VSPLPYRPCAGVMLLDARGLAFAGQRIDGGSDAWQMPQGGIDPGEDGLAAAVRELGEETGIAAEKVSLIAQAPNPIRYDLPPELVGRVWKGRWRGQEQQWFLFRFTGTDADVDIATAHPEFRSWRWMPPADLPAAVVPFKRALYEEVLRVFEPHL